jgi:hypothetical protein
MIATFPSEIAMLTFMGRYYMRFPNVVTQRSCLSRCGVKNTAFPDKTSFLTNPLAHCFRHSASEIEVRLCK